MGARAQLNGAHLTMGLIFAGLAAAVSGSLVVGLIAFVSLVVIGLVAGDIRPGPRGRRQ
jgi:hypothetical protein